MFRWFKNLSYQNSIQAWQTEIDNHTTEQDNDWKVKADTNKAAISYASYHNLKVLFFTFIDAY
jgi:hypothetical protein